MNITLEGKGNSLAQNNGPSSEGKYRVAAIPSKSHAHRLLFASALSDKECKLFLSTSSKDIDATRSCMESLGAKIDSMEGGLLVHPISLLNLKEQNTSTPISLDCGESGSTLRFLLPVIGALGLPAEIHMHGKLPERPLSPLYEEMEKHGISFAPQGSNPLTMKGKMTGGLFRIAGNISSQFITGLLLACPLLKEDSRIKVLGEMTSRPYIDITLEVIRQFGIEVLEDKDNQTFYIKGNQTYHGADSIQVTGDWSNAAFFLSAGALLKEPVTLTGLDPSSLQGDKEIVSILRRFGAKVTQGPRSFTICGNELHGINIDAENIPDLVPILSLVAALAKGETRISHIARLRIKESDRVASIMNTLIRLGANIREEDNTLIIEGVESLHTASISSYNDHRIAMMAAIASLRTEGSVTIEGAEAVQKSYPAFFEDFAIFSLCISTSFKVSRTKM